MMFICLYVVRLDYHDYVICPSVRYYIEFSQNASYLYVPCYLQVFAEMLFI